MLSNIQRWIREVDNDFDGAVHLIVTVEEDGKYRAALLAADRSTAIDYKFNTELAFTASTFERALEGLDNFCKKSL